MTDEWTLSFFYIRETSTIYLEFLQVIDKVIIFLYIIYFLHFNKTEEIRKNMLSKSNSTTAKYLKSLGFFKHIATPIDTIPESQVELNEEYRSKIYHGSTSMIYGNDEHFRERIIETIKNNQIQSFRELMDEKDDFNIDSLGSTGWSLLHYASFHGYSDFVMELITKYGANVNLPNIDGWTPLHLCSYKGYLEIVIILLSKEETDVNNNVTGIGTPLHCACKKNNTGVVSILLHYSNFK
jgi:hypothetical protein